MLPYYAEKLKKQKIKPNIINDYVKGCEERLRVTVGNTEAICRSGLLRPKNFGSLGVTDTRFFTENEYRTMFAQRTALKKLSKRTEKIIRLQQICMSLKCIITHKDRLEEIDYTPFAYQS